MAKILSPFTNGKKPMPIAVAEEELVNKYTFNVTAAQNVAGNVLSFFILPADHVLVGFTLRADDMDSGTTITFDLGILTADGTAVSALAADGGAKLVSASTLAQAGGLLISTATAAAWKQIGLIPPQPYDREFGIAILTSPAGAGAGGYELEFRYRPA